MTDHEQTFSEPAQAAEIVRNSLDYRWKQDRALGALDGLVAEILRLREEIRLREESQIPMIPHGAAVRLERAEQENERLREALGQIARDFPGGRREMREFAERVLRGEE